MKAIFETTWITICLTGLQRHLLLPSEQKIKMVESDKQKSLEWRKHKNVWSHHKNNQWVWRVHKFLSRQPYICLVVESSNPRSVKKNSHLIKMPLSHNFWHSYLEMNVKKEIEEEKGVCASHCLIHSNLRPEGNNFSKPVKSQSVDPQLSTVRTLTLHWL